MPFRDETILAHLIAARAETQADFPVLTFEGGEARADEVRTYGQLWENGQRIARALHDAGLQPGECFALLMQNHPEFVEAMIAASITATVFVPIDPRSCGAKLAHLLRDSGCRGVVCTDDALPALLEIQPELPDLTWMFVLGPQTAQPLPAGPCRVSRLSDVLDTHAARLPVAVKSPAEPMQILYTSGTTGDPKGIVIRHARFGTVAGHGETVFGYRQDDRLYTGLSLTHGNAQFVTLASALSMGIPAVFSRRFTKSRLWQIVRQYRCTSFTLLGGMATALYSEPPRPDDADNPVRFVVSAGMPAAIWEDFSLRFGVEICEFYGALEGGMTINRIGEGPIGSCGRAPPGLEARVVDDDGNDCPVNVSGELVFRFADGRPIALEYFNNPLASQKKLRNGWLRSGDIAYMNADSWVFYQHRQGGGIRHNGEFISPAFVEKVIAGHPSVADVFVYGIAASSGAPGEKDVVAAIVPLDETSFDPDALVKHCRTQLEPNFVPGLFQVVNEIPKTASEKPQERFLIDMLRSEPERIFHIPAQRRASQTGSAKQG